MFFNQVHNPLSKAATAFGDLTRMLSVFSAEAGKELMLSLVLSTSF